MKAKSKISIKGERLNWSRGSIAQYPISSEEQIKGHRLSKEDLIKNAGRQPQLLIP